MNEIEQNISFACKKPFKIIKTIKENRVYIVEVETETLIYKQEQLPRVVDAIFFQKKCI